LPSAYPSAKLNKVVLAALQREDWGVTWADRAFPFDLNGDGKPEYFVPLGCGGTGNCSWGVFALSPARILGVLGGKFIYVHKRAGHWTDIITYTHMSASEGILATYSFRKKRYVWLGDKYPTNVDTTLTENDIPKFLKKARGGCGLHGN